MSGALKQLGAVEFWLGDLHHFPGQNACLVEEL